MRDLPHYRHVVQGLPEKGEQKPLLVFLHGSGERGRDLDLVRRHGPPGAFPQFGLDRFVLVAPQCPQHDVWNDCFLAEFVSATVDAYPVDRARVYLTGISMGGVGAWELGTGFPDLFSALVPICGGGDAHRVSLLLAAERTIPVWLFHSAADCIMPVGGSDAIFDALRAKNAYAVYTRYNDLNHVQTWERAYGSSMLYDWFLTRFVSLDEKPSHHHG